MHPSSLISDSPELDEAAYRDIPAGSTVYVGTRQLRFFIDQVARNLEVDIVLVTGDADLSVPGGPLHRGQIDSGLLENPRILHWFGQNMTLRHSKISPLPIGLDYHTLQGEGWKGEAHGRGGFMTAKEQEAELFAIRDSLPSLEQRPPTVYANFGPDGGGPRSRALRALGEQPFVLRERERVPRAETWRQHGNVSFVLSPPGHGLDCHRTWEALVLGCIPVMELGPLADLLRDLPALFVDSWENVTQEALERFKASLEGWTPDWEKLTLGWWTAAFARAAQAP